MIYPQEQTDFPALFEAVGCICCSRGKILLLKRECDKSYPARWGIPGGKVKENESRLRAIIRELFEETGILLSADNLDLVKTYHIVTEEMSFFYTVYRCQFESIPKIIIRSGEHTRFGWFSPNDALSLELVPDLDLCLRDTFFSLNYNPVQLELFPPGWYIARPSAVEFEQSVIGAPKIAHWNETKSGNPWYVSLGPPATGKTTALKLMSKENPNLRLVTDTTVLRRTSRLNFYIRKAFEEDEHSFFFPFQMEILPVRFLQILRAPAYSLVDETIYSVLAYSRALYWLKWLKEHEYQTFYNNYLIYFNMAPSPDTIFYFNCDTSTIIKRIKRRGRKHEIYYSIEYIEALCCAFSEVARELSKTYKVVSIDTTKLLPHQIVKLYGP